MAAKSFFLGTGLLLLGAATGLILTNPGPAAYEAFAVEQARGYLKTDVCPKELPFIGKSLEAECHRFVESEAAQPQIQALISRGTERQNFVLFSLYRTELSAESLFPLIPSGVIPAYEVKSVGLLRSLHIYAAETL
ncbi:MAG: DUF4359 domain-containing protein [Synechococcales cyanobacterium RU_4_20]|nr:DUF4359 domain-containing protein [Synechococcales cyanobacterium RU_4_20]NJR70354.1 DUF4359 domain-containing protein [Synechococcales cyanobacterium CRU_2_2]